jgi:hypothetical protein
MLFAAALAIVAIVLALPVLHLGERAARNATAPPAAPAGLLDPRRVCVTRAGLCPVGAVRAGDPCTCPDPIRGNVVGHVETVGGPPSDASPRDWPGDTEDLLYGP